jgi:hypothetical protein
MPRNSGTIKAAKLHRGKSRGKLVEWESRELARGIRDVPVKVNAMESQSKPRNKAGRLPRAENSNPLQGEAAPQSMEVDETFGVEEPTMPTSEKRVREPTCPSSTSLTHLPYIALLHRRIYPKDWPLLTLPPRF